MISTTLREGWSLGSSINDGKNESMLLERVAKAAGWTGPGSGFLETGRLNGGDGWGFGGFGFLGLGFLVSTMSLRF